MKVVKLTIDEDNEFEGIDAVALVAEPATEIDFQYFNKQQATLTTEDIIRKELSKLIVKEEFADIKEIEGVPVFVNESQANQMASNIGCAGSHKHEVEGTTYYMPCQSHTIATDKMLKKNEFHSEKYFDNFTDDEKEQLLKSLSNVGKNEADIIADGWVELTEDEFNNNLYAEFA
jgi:hypothetical protein